jgi:drug/metabolite transporter (DMT)-like permease
MLLLYGGCAILITPLAQPLQLVQLDPWHWVALLFCALNTLVAYGSFAEALEHWEASRVGAVLTITPLTTLAAELLVAQFFPQILAPEHFTLLGLGGALLVVGGSLAMALGKK